MDPSIELQHQERLRPRWGPRLLAFALLCEAALVVGAAVVDFIQARRVASDLWTLLHIRATLDWGRVAWLIVQVVVFAGLEASSAVILLRRPANPHTPTGPTRSQRMVLWATAAVNGLLAVSMFLDLGGESSVSGWLTRFVIGLVGLVLAGGTVRVIRGWTASSALP